jgi:hypothetical protein
MEQEIYVEALIAKMTHDHLLALQIAFFDNKAQDGNAISKVLTIGTTCTSCTGFGLRLTNSW